jgi:hypothetical protein
MPDRPSTPALPQRRGPSVRFPALAGILLLAVQASAGWAGEIAGLHPGAELRVRGSGLAINPARGSLASFDTLSLRLFPTAAYHDALLAGQGSVSLPVEIPWRQVERLEVLQSRHSRTDTFLGLGLAAGTVLGMVIGPLFEPDKRGLPRNVEIAYSTGIGALVGSIVGAAYGASHPAETWREVPVLADPVGVK